MNILKFSVDRIDFIEEINNSQFAKVKIQAFASGDNAHSMPVSEEILKLRADTIYHKPLVWIFDKYTNDIGGHDPDEIPCGFVHRENNPIEFIRLEDGRLMLTVQAMIWKRYSGEILSLFKRDGLEKPVSVEIQVIETKPTWDGKQEIIDYCYTAITILGTNVRPAIKNAKAEILEFSADKKAYEDLYFSNCDLTIPATVKENAKKGLNLQKQYKYGGTNVGISTAKLLISNQFASPELIRKINQFFPKHLANSNKFTNKNDEIASFLWGGLEGFQWVKKLISTFETNNKSEINYIQEEDEKMSFTKTPEMFAKVVEYCNGIKFQNKEIECSKFEVVDYSENHIFAIDNENKKMSAIPYTYSTEEDKFEANVEDKKNVKMSISFEVSEDEDDNKVMMSIAKSLFTTDANLEPLASVARSKKETDGDKESVEKMEKDLEDVKTKMSEMEVKMSEINSENEELKKFKETVLEQEKTTKIEFTANEVSESGMPAEKINEWKDKITEFSTVDAWVNAVKADAFNYVKENVKSDGFLKIGVPYSNSNSNSKKSLWED